MYHISLSPISQPGRWANMRSSLRSGVDILTACIWFWRWWILGGILCGPWSKVDLIPSNHSRGCLYHVRLGSACWSIDASWICSILGVLLLAEMSLLSEFVSDGHRQSSAGLWACGPSFESKVCMAILVRKCWDAAGSRFVSSPPSTIHQVCIHTRVVECSCRQAMQSMGQRTWREDFWPF